MTENRRGTDKRATKPKKPTAKPEGENYPRKAIPCVSAASDDEKGRSYADLITSSELAAYRVIGMMQPKNLADEIDAPTMLATLRDHAAAVQNGDLSQAEAMLVNQAEALQSLFVRLTERSMEQQHMPNLEGYMRLALRAQSQCRATVETLATIKNPPIVYAKQANFAAGHQQVNNGMPVSNTLNSTRAHTHAEENLNQQNKLLEVQHGGETMDTGAAGAAIGADPTMATVGEIHRG